MVFRLLGSLAKCVLAACQLRLIILHATAWLLGLGWLGMAAAPAQESLFRPLQPISDRTPFGPQILRDSGVRKPSLNRPAAHWQVDDSPASAQAGLEMAIIAYENEKYESALQMLEAIATPDVLVDYYRAQCLLALGRAEESQNLLRELSTNPDAPSSAQLDLGVAQLQAGQTDAAERTLRDYVEKNPDDPYGRYFFGTTLQNQNDPDAAAQQFDAARGEESLAPFIQSYRGDVANGSPADPSRGALNGTPGNVPRRRWNYTILNAYEYDSNVGLLPQFTGLGAVTNKQDSRYVLASFGDFRIVQETDKKVGLVTSTYDSFNHVYPRFNFQDYMGGGYANASLGRKLFGIRYEFHESLLNQQPFAQEHRLVPNFSFLEGAFGHTTTYYEYDNNRFNIPILIPAQNRSGTIHAVGATQAIYTSNGNGRLFAGYRFERAFTEGTDFDRRTSMVTGRIEQPINRRTIADAEVRYFWDNYLNPNSLDFFNQPRRDRRVEVRSGFQFYFPRHLSLRLDYTFVDAHSNVANLFDVKFFQYNRHIVSAQVIYDF